MVAINFSHQFAGAVEHGLKRQTIRDKTQARMGEPLQLFTGQRTKACRKLGEHICIDVSPVTLWEKMAQLRGSVLLMGMYLEEFARKDGFTTYADMWLFFKARANENGEYHGVMVRW